jgi:hypothetical protein
VNAPRYQRSWAELSSSAGLSAFSPYELEASVTARGNTSRGTSVGSKAARAGFSKDAEHAIVNTIAYSNGTLTNPLLVATKRTNAHARGTSWASMMMRRRS